MVSKYSIMKFWLQQVDMNGINNINRNIYYKYTVFNFVNIFNIIPKNCSIYR